MADTKITALTAITTVDPAVDVLPIVDVSDTTMAASGTTKKITSNQILGAGGTATLASATITGVLTAGTNSIIGTGSTQNAAANRGNLTIGGTSSAILNLSINGADTGYIIHDGTNITFNNRTNGYVEFFANGLAQHRIAPLGVFSWYDGAGGTAMTLNSTGLGIGVSPVSGYKLSSGKTTGEGQFSATTGSAAGTASVPINIDYDFLGYNNQLRAKIRSTDISNNASNGILQFWTVLDNVASQNMTLDASGNLLVGKTASNSSVIGAELRPSGAIISTLAASTNADFALYTYSTGAAAARFYVGMSGTVFATNTTISAISDQRLKENVQDIDVGLGAILALKPRKFDWKDGKGKDIKGDRGFIAQEFEQVFPQLVDEWADPAPEGEAPYKSVRQDLIPVLVKAIQELAAEVNALKNA
jgi:hypothetical protein